MKKSGLRYKLKSEEIVLAIYELRTYTLRVGVLKEAIGYYNELGWPALNKGGFSKKLVGYFIADTGTINSLVHMWKFDDDEDRRAHYDLLFEDQDFMNFAAKFRPLVQTQEVQLLTAAPWGPHP